MGLICKLKGHNWLYGKCRRCGERHQDHQWIGNKEKSQEHRFYCKICGATYISEHEWNGCACKICGENRNSNHIWISETPCIEHCSVCYKKNVHHSFKKIDGKCIEKCSQCGEKREMAHKFENGICTECGLDQNEYLAKKAIALSKHYQKESWQAAREITVAKYLEQVILEADDHYVKLCCVSGIEKLNDDNALMRIAGNTELDYEVRKKAQGCIKDKTMRDKLHIQTDPVYEAMYDADIKSGM